MVNPLFKLFTAVSVGFFLILDVARINAAADWNLVVYLNGDNADQPYAEEIFKKLARAGSSDLVNILVLYDRKAPFHPKPETDTEWWCTRIFHVTKGMAPTVSNSLTKNPVELSMTDWRVLRDFVNWCDQNYPAKRTAVVIWGHGTGWNFMGSGPPPKPNEPHKVLEHSKLFQAQNELPCYPLHDYCSRPDKHEIAQIPILFEPAWVVTPDNTDENRVLQVNELRWALEQRQNRRPVDVLFLVACYMGSLETFTEFENVAEYQLLTEVEQDKLAGPSEQWVNCVKHNSKASARSVALAAVEVCRKEFQEQTGHAGVSCVESKQIAKVNSKLNILADCLRILSHPQFTVLKEVRKQTISFAPPLSLAEVDLGAFCLRLRATGEIMPEAARAAEGVLMSLDAAMPDSFATGCTYHATEANGLSIFFPRCKANLGTALGPECYKDNSTICPLAFLNQSHWDEFVRGYLKRVE